MLTYLDSQRRKFIIQIRSDWKSLALVLFNITKIIYNSVSRRLNILCIMFTVYSTMSEGWHFTHMWNTFTRSHSSPTGQVYKTRLIQARNGHVFVC